MIDLAKAAMAAIGSGLNKQAGVLDNLALSALGVGTLAGLGIVAPKVIRMIKDPNKDPWKPDQTTGVDLPSEWLESLDENTQR